MFELLNKGMIKNKNDPPKMIKRPVFENLFKLKV